MPWDADHIPGTKIVGIAQVTVSRNQRTQANIKAPSYDRERLSRPYFMGTHNWCGLRGLI
jgi:hypothetical protein